MRRAFTCRRIWEFQGWKCEKYKLDPAWYYTSPGHSLGHESHDACLNVSGLTQYGTHILTRLLAIEKSVHALRPQAARAGTRTMLTLSPTPPVLCLPTTSPDQSDGWRSRPPDLIIASVNAAVSESVIPRTYTAISIAPTFIIIYLFCISHWCKQVENSAKQVMWPSRVRPTRYAPAHVQ